AYLPTQLDDEEVAALVATALDEVTARLGERPGLRQMGQVMKVVTPRVAGRADGSRVAAAVRAALGS
ncbi:MAG: GatB/YqeY domain-containing protein, partial [Pseudonocardiaceae bacterium]